MACLQRRGGRVRVIKENHSFNDFESEQLSLVSEAFSFLFPFTFSVNPFLLRGVLKQTPSIYIGMAIHFG